MSLAAEFKSVRGLQTSLAILLLAGAASSGIFATKNAVEESRTAEVTVSSTTSGMGHEIDAHVADQIARQLAESP